MLTTAHDPCRAISGRTTGRHELFHQVDVEALHPDFIRNLFKVGSVAHTEIVNEDVGHSAKGAHHRRNRPIDALGSGKVDGDGARPPRGSLSQRRFVAIRHDNARAFLRKQVRDGFTDAMRACADKRAFATNLIIHACSRLQRSPK